MLNVLLVFLVPVLLCVMAARVARAYERPGEPAAPLVPIMIAAYGVRVVMHFVAQKVQLFSHGIGGDAQQYQAWSEYIGAIWRRQGIHMVNADELPLLGRTILPPNLFALVTYVNGDHAYEGCAALSAGFAGVTALNLYALAMDLGAASKRALLVVAVFLFLPGFILYSSDTYKDPMVWMLTFGLMGSSIRLVQEIRVRDVVIGVVCAWCLWYIRFYLVFLTVAPLAVGLLGINTKNPARTLLMVLVAATALIPLLAYTKVLGDITDQAATTFEGSTNAISRVNTAKDSGSGVVFDDGGKFYGALPTKLVYTLFAPFVWQGGSFGFHVGKIDALVWFYFAYRAYVAAKYLMRTRPELLFAMLTFIVPTTLVYAFSMYNIGLILRQRMPVVIVTMLLASLSWPEDRVALAEDEDREDEPDDEYEDPEGASESDDALEPEGHAEAG